MPKVVNKSDVVRIKWLRIRRLRTKKMCKRNVSDEDGSFCCVVRTKWILVGPYIYSQLLLANTHVTLFSGSTLWLNLGTHVNLDPDVALQFQKLNISVPSKSSDSASHSSSSSSSLLTSGSQLLPGATHGRSSRSVVSVHQRLSLHVRERRFWHERRHGDHGDHSPYSMSYTAPRMRGDSRSRVRDWRPETECSTDVYNFIKLHVMVFVI